MTGLLDLLSDDERHDLIARGRQRRFPAHSILFFEGDAPHDVVLVRGGDVKVVTTIGGREVVLDVAGPGAVVGELGVIDGTERSAMAVALSDVDAVVVPAAEFHEFLEHWPGALPKVLKSVTRRLRETSRRQAEYGALDAVGRVCRRLVELIDRYGQTDGDTTVIASPLTQGDIAAWAGLSREAVVRVLHDLRGLGWVRTSAKSIVVIDTDSVRMRASVPSA
jgi:CRP/FNR family cyclic AMP-dependent transcriptional regulator